MTKPIKKTGFTQGIYEISSTAKEAIGTLRQLHDGREFYYARAGATALAVGKATVAAAVAAAVTNQALTAALAVGATSLTYTAGSSVTYAADYFRGGYLQVNDATGEGHQYQIKSSAAVTSGTSIGIVLEDPIAYALTTSSEATLVHNPYMATIISATPESLFTGVPPVAVTASYYYWSQKKGLACGLCTGTPAVGTMLTHGAVDGSFGAINATLDIDQPLIAVMVNTGVDTEYKSIMLI